MADQIAFSHSYFLGIVAAANGAIFAGSWFCASLVSNHFSGKVPFLNISRQNCNAEFQTNRGEYPPWKTFGEWLRAPVLASILKQRLLCRLATLAALAHVLLSSLGVHLFACPLMEVAHIPCPGCGLTRGVKALLLGDLQHSFQLHAFSPLVLLVFSFMAVCSILPQRMLSPLVERIERWERRTAISNILFLCLWIYWICRLASDPLFLSAVSVPLVSLT